MCPQVQHSSGPHSKHHWRFSCRIKCWQPGIVRKSSCKMHKPIYRMIKWCSGYFGSSVKTTWWNLTGDLLQIAQEPGPLVRVPLTLQHCSTGEVPRWLGGVWGDSSCCRPEAGPAPVTTLTMYCLVRSNGAPIISSPQHQGH